MMAVAGENDRGGAFGRRCLGLAQLGHGWQRRVIMAA